MSDNKQIFLLHLTYMNRIKKYQMLDYISENIEEETTINEHRIYILNKSNKYDGDIYYVIDREFRLNDNYAVQYGRTVAEKENKKFNIIFNCPVFEIKTKQNFFDEEFKKVQNDCNDNNLDFVIFKNPTEINSYLKNKKPYMVLIDFNPIRKKSIKTGDFNFIEIDGHNIIPARYISEKQEYNAASFRRKVYLNISEFLTEYNSKSKNYNNLIRDFIERKLPLYAEYKNNPVKKCTSGFSKYMTYGFLSAKRIAFEILKADTNRLNKEAFLEELIVRQELSDNFCLYCKNFKTIDCVPNWAKETLNSHKHDIRTSIYPIEKLEHAQTCDELWNAAQKQLLKEGKIEGYLRMYWAKMLLNWTISAQEAIDIAIYLNDKYAFDAPSANGYAAILWSIAGLHDRAFAERPVFGKIRTMTYKGAKSKFDIQKYIEEFKN